MKMFWIAGALSIERSLAGQHGIATVMTDSERSSWGLAWGVMFLVWGPRC